MSAKAWICAGLLIITSAGHAADEAAKPSEEAAKPSEEATQPAEKAFIVPGITNLDRIAKDLKVSRFKSKTFGTRVKIAVLDNGFNGFESAKGKSLPESTVYHKGPESEADKIKTPSFHGLLMAQILVGVIEKSGAKLDYELHLFNTYGYTKFAGAVKTIIEEKFDLVLYSQVWEFGGNGDGKGYINTLVNQALDAGIIWINAAGNFGRLMRIAPVDGKVDGQDEWVLFNNAKGKTSDFAELECSGKKGDTCNLRLVAAWNDFKDQEGIGTDKDLDLILLDKKGKSIGSSERVQKLTKSDVTMPNDSLYPRELIETTIAPGSYKIKIKVKSKNFSASQDKVRLTVSGIGVFMKEVTEGETLLPPADNPGVIVVGAADDSQSSVSKSKAKPDVNIMSLVKLKDGSAPFASSNAAAMMAGIAALELGSGTAKNRETLTAELKKLNVDSKKLVANSEKRPRTVSRLKKNRRSQSQSQQQRTRGNGGYPQQQPGYSQPGYPQPPPQQLYEEIIIEEYIPVQQCWQC